ncbi:6-bladed beta-propeller [Maribellus comscasis]|uniref:6-bladed beta-propeller n=1 Tax=Maribellus comscasis TaxID=2681766 RepID=A0A6I6K365_9BACT|nr:6-bladed beta-propeller [Maribellus comscasis]QGY46987.1 6-bladed beta-propeller [Maribellus comscasis]
MKLTIALLFLLSLLISCKNNEQKTEAVDLYTVDLRDDPNIKSPLKLSSIVSDLTYVRLESNSKTIIAPGNRIFVLDSFVINTGFGKISVFDRNTGKFIREIGKIGRGPNEYQSARHNVHKDSSRGIVINTSGGRYSLLEFNINGQVVGRVETDPRTTYVTCLNGKNYAAFFANNSGDSPLRIRIYDQEKSVIASEFPNYQKAIKTSSHRRLGYEGWFYYFNNNLFFKEYLNDTIFQISENTLSPRFVFNSGEFSPSYEQREIFKTWEYHQLYYIMEAENQLFFELSFKKRKYYGYLDKTTRQSYLSNISGQVVSGFQNDVDNFLMFCPKSLNDNNELVGFTEAREVLKWFKENPEAASKLPLELQKLSDMEDYDNPVVVIAKLKE